jgi:hypothetical protein
MLVNPTGAFAQVNADKRKAVLTLFDDQTWGTWTDRAIAKYCRVSQPFVSSIRKELADQGHQFPVKRICLDGREMNVAQIGSSRGQDSQQTQASASEASENVQQEANSIEAQSATRENPAEDHPVGAETSENEADQVDVSESAWESQTDILESSASEAGGEPEHIAPSTEPQMVFFVG